MAHAPQGEAPEVSVVKRLSGQGSHDRTCPPFLPPSIVACFTWLPLPALCCHRMSRTAQYTADFILLFRLFAPQWLPSTRTKMAALSWPLTASGSAGRTLSSRTVCLNCVRDALRLPSSRASFANYFSSLLLAAFISALIIGVALHYHKIVENEFYHYPDEWFPSVSATIGDRYPERSFFMIFIAITSGTDPCEASRPHKSC